MDTEPPKTTVLVTLPEVILYLLRRIYRHLQPENTPLLLNDFSITALTEDEARHQGHEAKEGRRTLRVHMDVNGIRLDTYAIETGDASWKLCDTYLIFESPLIEKDPVLAMLRASVCAHVAESDDPSSSGNGRTITVRLGACSQ